MDLTSADFDGDRLKRGTAAVVFLADWCGYCRRFLRNHAADLANFPVPFLTADVSDEEDPLWDAFRIRVVPTVYLFKDGAPVWKKDGVSMLGLTSRDVEELRRRAAEVASAPK